MSHVEADWMYYRSHGPRESPVLDADLLGEATELFGDGA